MNGRSGGEHCGHRSVSCGGNSAFIRFQLGGGGGRLGGIIAKGVSSEILSIADSIHLDLMSDMRLRWDFWQTHLQHTGIELCFDLFSINFLR